MAYTPEFLTAKITAIGYVTGIYFLLGLVIAKSFDWIYGEFDKKKYAPEVENSTFWLGVDIFLHIFFLAIIFYVLRNFVERIPYPLEGFGGYQHSRLKELEGGPVLEFVGIFFQRNLKKKSEYFIERMFGN